MSYNSEPGFVTFVRTVFMGIALLCGIIGVILCFTGVGAIAGVPVVGLCYMFTHLGKTIEKGSILGALFAIIVLIAVIAGIVFVVSMI